MYIIDLFVLSYLIGIGWLSFCLYLAIKKGNMGFSVALILQVLVWPYYLLSEDGRRGLWKIITA